MQKNITYTKPEAENIISEFNNHLRLKYHRNSLILQASAGDGSVKIVTLPNGMTTILANARFKGELSIYNKMAKPGYLILTYAESISEKEIIPTTTRFYLSMADDNNHVKLPQGTKTKLVQIIFKADHLYKYIASAKIRLWLEDFFSSRNNFEEFPDLFVRAAVDELLQANFKHLAVARLIQTRCNILIEKFLCKTYPGPENNKIKKIEPQLFQSLTNLESRLYTAAAKPNSAGMITAAELTKCKAEFKVLYNVPAAAYMQQYKILKARYLLAGNDHDIETVAAITGFGKAQILKEEFKKYFNIQLR